MPQIDEAQASRLWGRLPAGRSAGGPPGGRLPASGLRYGRPAADPTSKKPEQGAVIPKISAVIFDFDETIIDLEPQHTAAHMALCRDYGADYAQMPESFRRGSGRRIIDDIREMRAHFGWTASEEELFVIRQRHFDAICARAELRAMDGVHEIVRSLENRGATLAITSSAVGPSIEQILLRLGLRDAFPLIVDGSEVAHGKPDPEAYRVTARKLGVPAAECVVFEDSHVGVLAAKRAGMCCIAVRNPRALELQDLSAADVVVESMTAVDVTAWAISR